MVVGSQEPQSEIKICCIVELDYEKCGDFTRIGDIRITKTLK